MNAIASSIEEFFATQSQDLSAYLAAMTLIGLAAMAVIQWIKDATPVRRWFHHFRLDRWLREGAADATTKQAPAIAVLGVNGVSIDKARHSLVELSVDGDTKALEDLPIEQFCGQMTTALQLALDNPKEHPDLFLVAGSEAGAEDMRILVATDRANLPMSSDGKATPEEVRYTDARARVTHQFQRAVDGFQIATGYRWRFWLQMAAFVVSAALASAAVGAKGSNAGVFDRIGVILFTAVLAGFIAPVARDLTAALQGLRRA